MLRSHPQLLQGRVLPGLPQALPVPRAPVARQHSRVESRQCSLLTNAAASVDELSAQQVAATGSGISDEDLYAAEDAQISSFAPESLGGDERLERLLAEGGSDLTVNRVCQIFPYPLDGFQRMAVEKFLEGQSVVVCAPTGAGKTAIAEAAAAATLARGQRVIYTTPLKALSNQKLFEMRKRFGSARCGLQTGDTSLNTDASIVIMTTEILRNIMYRIAEKAPSSSDVLASSGGSSSEADISSVRVPDVQGWGWEPQQASADGGELPHVPIHIAGDNGGRDVAGVGFELVDYGLKAGGSGSSSGASPSMVTASSTSSSSSINSSHVAHGWGHPGAPHEAWSSQQGSSGSSEAGQGGSDAGLTEASWMNSLQADWGPGAGSEMSGGEPAGVQAAREERLGDVGLVVMDEVHYLGDPNRGSVWEEAIINCPRHIQLVCMSATVKNPDELGGWIAKEHMPCVTIKTRFRPVPLQWQHAYTAAPPRGVQLVDLLAAGDKALNPRLSRSAIIQEEARAILQRQSRGGGKPSMDPVSLAKSLEGDKEMLRKVMSKRVPSMDSLIMRMRSRELLPAIWFILSRKECDLSAIRASSSSLCLTTKEEQETIKAELELLQLESPESVREQMVQGLMKGVASHHAGQLPGWKSLVERLFQKGCLKVVFATGTLAAGINMPARTTVISALGRMTDDGPKLLPHNELLQMAGRAGRRGFDTEGHCIILQTRFEGPEDAWSIIHNGPEPLISQFNVSYGLVLNLLSVYSLEQARKFCNKSFGAYQRVEGEQRKAQEVAALEAQAVEIMAQYNATATTAAKELAAGMKEAKDSLRRLRAEALAGRMQAAQAALQANPLPRKVMLDLTTRTDVENGSKRVNQLPAVLVGEVDADEVLRLQEEHAASIAPGSEFAVPPAPGPYFKALGADNRLLRVSVLHVVGIVEGPDGSLPPDDVAKVVSAVSAVRQGGWVSLEAKQTSVQAAVGGSATAVVALQLQSRGMARMFAVDPALQQRILTSKEAVKEVQARVDAQRGGWGGLGSTKSTTNDRVAMSMLSKAKRLQAQASQLRAELNTTGEDTWRKFEEVVSILTAMSALEPGTLRLLPVGLAARSLKGQNELWLALVLTHPALINLSGPQLAGLLGAILSAEVLRKTNSIFTAYSASDTLVEAVDALEEQRQMLSQLQADAGLGMWNDALLLDLRLAGVVEAWAAGATWGQVMADCGMDDGDLARLLIRTVDLLKQVAHEGALLPYLRDAAMEALKGMDRKPIAETLI